MYKNKYIYRIYESSDEVLHIQKYPIVYMNDNWIYYKVGRKQSLGCFNIENLKDPIISKYKTWYNEYFLDVDENELKELFNDLQQQKAINISKCKEEQIRERFKKAKKEFQEALTELEILEQLKLEKMSNKKNNKDNKEEVK